MEGAGGRARVARIVLDYAARRCRRRLSATAVLPVKRFDDAKQRLAAGLDEERRRALVAAMVADVLEAIGEARAIERTIVVSGDPVAQEIAAEVGAEVVPDPARRRPRRGGAGGDRPRRSRRRRLRRPPPRRLPAARPARARPAADRRARALRRRSSPTATASGTNALVLSARRARSSPPSARAAAPATSPLAREAGVPFGVEELASLGARPRHPGRRDRPDPRAGGPPRPRPRTAKALGI